jgi:hypothetical protein
MRGQFRIDFQIVETLSVTQRHFLNEGDLYRVKIGNSLRRAANQTNKSVSKLALAR